MEREIAYREDKSLFYFHGSFIPHCLYGWLFDLAFFILFYPLCIGRHALGAGWLSALPFFFGQNDANCFYYFFYNLMIYFFFASYDDILILFHLPI